jgi:hypothetical protein
MGTRGLTGVVLDGEIKVMQYGQWDHYLKGQGKTVIDFIGKMNVKKFAEAVRECRFVSEAVIKKTWTDCGADDSGMVTMDISEKHRNLYPAFSRDTCAGILGLIYDGKEKRSVRTEKGEWKNKTLKHKPVRELDDQRSFASDSLFCEWAYVVDMDKQMLEIYQGFNYDKPKGRFAKMRPTGGKSSKGKSFQAISLWQTVAFAQIKKDKATLAWLIEINEAEEKKKEEEAEAREAKAKTAKIKALKSPL